MRERQILDGLGSVDVALEKDERSIACEISVTTTPEQELGNIQKCLAAGFNYVVLIATEKKTLSKVAEAATGLGAQELERVRFFMPEELFSFLEEREAEAATTEETVRGYKVKTRFKPVAAGDQKAKKQAIAKTIAEALKRLKRKA